jgi:hypothetical protein
MFEIRLHSAKKSYRVVDSMNQDYWIPRHQADVINLPTTRQIPLTLSLNTRAYAGAPLGRRLRPARSGACDGYCAS